MNKACSAVGIFKDITVHFDDHICGLLRRGRTHLQQQQAQGQKEIKKVISQREYTRQETQQARTRPVQVKFPLSIKQFQDNKKKNILRQDSRLEYSITGSKRLYTAHLYFKTLVIYFKVFPFSENAFLLSWNGSDSP